MSIFGLKLTDLLISIPAILICITFHEFAHGWAAYKLGDNTASDAGRLSLNPLSHIDPIGFICLILFRFGWAKPVPVNPYNFKKPRSGMAITSAAGPAANFLLCFVLLFISRGLYNAPYSAFLYALITFLETTAIISAGLGVFNLLPVPPLDGSNIIMPILPVSVRKFFFDYGKYIQIALILMLYLGWLSRPLGVVRSFIINGLYSAVNAVWSAVGL